MEYDFFVAGRWRNKDNIESVLNLFDESKIKYYCFIRQKYNTSEPVTAPSLYMEEFEKLKQDDPKVYNLFKNDLIAQKKSNNFLLVLPAGKAGHIEAGIAYGLGKKCYAIGNLEQTETLYCIFEKVFPDLEALKNEILHKSK